MEKAQRRLRPGIRQNEQVFVGRHSRVELTCSTADTGAAQRDGAHGRAGERTTELT